MQKLLRASRGRLGGALIGLLLVGSLGGVAFAATGAHGNGATEASPADERPSPEASEQGDGQQGATHAPAHTAASCAAGLTDIQSTLPPAEQATGLAHAIQVVEGNCEKNLQAPGLIVALGHLATNEQRHLAHEADKAAGAHGNSQDHGQSAAHGGSEQGDPSAQDGQD